MSILQFIQSWINSIYSFHFWAVVRSSISLWRKNGKHLFLLSAFKKRSKWGENVELVFSIVKNWGGSENILYNLSPVCQNAFILFLHFWNSFFSCSLASFQNLHNLKIFFSEFLLFFFLVIIIQNVKHTAAQSMTTDGDMEQQYLGEDYLYISKVPAHTPILTTINKRVEHQEVRVSKSLKPNFIYCHLKLLLLL